LFAEAPKDEILKELLLTAQTIAVVGVSDKADRPSYGVAQWLIENSHLDVYLVNPRVNELFGKKVYPTLADLPVKIDIVDVFRNIADAPAILDETIAIGAKVFWLQLGLSDQAVAENASVSGIIPVMNRCSKIEYQRLIK
jgi:predicted CoA-binding protein